MMQKFKTQVTIAPEVEIDVNFRWVTSSNVELVGWDKYRNMYIRFKSGAMYVYTGVSRQRAVACAYAGSVGQFVNTRIKPNFEAVRL